MFLWGKACANVCSPSQPSTIYPQPNPPQQSYPPDHQQPVDNYQAHALPCLLACCACSAYHRVTTHYTRHKTSNITKNYIYINIIYYINHKVSYIERQSLTRLYCFISLKIIP